MPNRQNKFTTSRTSKKGLYKTNASVWYNKTRRQLQLTPIYISIKEKVTNRQRLSTLQVATRFRINQKLKILYIKIQNANECHKLPLVYFSIV